MTRSHPSLTRRQALQRASGAAGGLFAVPAVGMLLDSSPSAAATVSSASTAATATPELTEGPYWVNTMLHRSNVLVNSNGQNRQVGVPLSLYINVLEEKTGKPMNGLAVDIWHANAYGIYSDESSQATGGGDSSAAEDTISDNFLRGYQLTGKDKGLAKALVDGQVSFQTIWPGWYTGRTIHIHVRVRKLHSTGATIAGYTTQICFDQALNDHIAQHASPYNRRSPKDDPTTNRSDTVISDADFKTNIITPKGNIESGYTATFNVVITSAESRATGSLARPSTGRTSGGAPGGGTTTTGAPGTPPSGATSTGTTTTTAG